MSKRDAVEYIKKHGEVCRHDLQKAYGLSMDAAIRSISSLLVSNTMKIHVDWRITPIGKRKYLVKYLVLDKKKT